MHKSSLFYRRPLRAAILIGLPVSFLAQSEPIYQVTMSAQDATGMATGCAIQYYRKAGNDILSMYDSMTGGARRNFECDPTISPVKVCVNTGVARPAGVLLIVQ